MDTIPLEQIEFNQGQCSAVEIHSLDARGAGKIVLLNKKGEVIKYYDPSTATIFITVDDDKVSKGS